MKHCAYNKKVFTSLCVVGVRSVGATTGSEILESHDEKSEVHS